MKKIFSWILGHKAAVLSVFAVGCLVCALLYPQIRVDYDMNDYLPKGAASTTAIDVMKDEFGGGIPNARVMVSGVSVAEALQYKQKLAKIDGVTDVTWLDDAVDVKEPLETQDADTVQTYYKNNNALYTVTIADDKRVSAVNAIRGLIGGSNAMSGPAVLTAAATQSTMSELSVIVKIAVLVVLLILVLTTTSWAEPVVMLAAIGIAIVLNAGSNLMFGTISFVTSGAGNILQLAVSLDFSVFLLHSYEEHRQKGLGAKEAMLAALCGSFGTILSCGLTLVIGFAALILMRFRIGPDLGLALAKGICFSLLTVFTLFPVLMLLADHWIEKTRHRPFLPKFDKFGHAVSRAMLPLALVFCLLIAPGFLARDKNDFYYGSEHIFQASTQVGRDINAINTAFGKSNAMVLIVPKGDTAKETELNNALKGIPQISSVLSYVNNVGAEVPVQYLDADTLSKLESRHYSRMVLTAKTSYEGDEAFSLVKTIRGTAEKYYPGKWYLAGESVSTYDLMDTIQADDVRVNLIAVGAVFLVLLVMFRSLTVPVVLVLSIETAIWINQAIPYFAGTTLFYISYLIIGSIQLGATVDYAILFANRYLGFRKTLPKMDAVRRTVAVTTVPIITSGSILVVVGYLLGFISSHGILNQLGKLLGTGTLLSMGIVFFVLPGLLYVLDKPIEKTSGNLHFLSKELKS